MGFSFLHCTTRFFSLLDLLFFTAGSTLSLAQIAASQNRVYLTADNLVLNLQEESFTRYVE